MIDNSLIAAPNTPLFSFNFINRSMYCIHIISRGMVGPRIVLFFNNSPNDDIFLESRLAVSHGSSLIQIVVVQLPFSHFVDILVCNRVSVDDRIALGNKTMVEQITNTETTIAAIIIICIYEEPEFYFCVNNL